MRKPWACMAIALAVSSAHPVAAQSGPFAGRIYPAPKSPLTLAGLPGDAALISVRTADGLTLSGIEVPARAGMPTLLAFHGNASSAAGLTDWFKPMLAKGYGLIAAEYRGYSGNPGAPDEPGLAADADAFYAYAGARTAAERVWIVGHSLGGGVALGLATRRRAQAVLTIGAFTRLRAMVPAVARAMVPNAYDNQAAVAKLGVPYFLVHGTADSTVPWQEGEQLHKAAGAAHLTGASFVVLGAEHRPTGEQLAQIFEVARSRMGEGQFRVAGLPAEIKVIPFGQSKPLSP